nr:MAG TPA: hypothetical protein [Caudoviricetes sp.]
MTTRQYIGARYVPKFANPINWIKENSYEALTIVTYLNNSYTSKKRVPPNTEITNEEYWCVTGNYNAQVEEYRRETEKIAEKIRDEFANKMVIISDSYGLTPSIEDNWIVNFANNLGLKVNDDYVSYSEGGASFGGTDGFPLFQNMVSQIDLKNINPIDVGYVIICGGFNDLNGVHGSSSDNIKNGISNLKRNIDKRFPNAKTYVGFIGWSAEETKLIPSAITLNDYITSCAINGINYLNNVEYAMHYDTFFQADNIHPTNIGAKEIANAVTNAIISGSANVAKPFKNATYKLSNGVTMDKFVWIVATELKNESTFVHYFYNADETVFNFSVPINNIADFELCEISDTYLIGNEFKTTSAVLSASFTDTDKGVVDLPVNVYVKNKKVYLRVTGSTIYNKITQVRIKGRSNICVSSMTN